MSADDELDIGVCGHCSRPRKALGNQIAAQMQRVVHREQLPPEAEILMLLINGASEIDRLEAEVKHLRAVKP